MTGGTTAMKNTLYNEYPGLRLPRQYVKKRMQMVIQEELTDLQRQTLLDYYYRRRTIPQIAAERNVNKSTVSRTLRRAEATLRRFMKY